MENTLLETAVRALDSHKAEALTALRVTGLTSVTDCFLLASGGSATQVRALSDYLEETLAKAGYPLLRSEGYRTGDWITLDYGDLIVHLFRRETRDFYGLERLWADAQRPDLTPYLIQEPIQ